MSVDTVEQPVAPAAEPVQVVPDEQLPVRAHAAKYSDAGRQKDAEALANETPEQKTARQEAAAKQKRDKDSGEFREGKARHKAESQKASPEDVPRIHQLTARAKTAEERAERAERELATLRSQGAPKQEIARAEAKVDAAEKAVGTTFTEPEPTEDDPKFAGDYGKYLRAVSGWEGRKAYHDAKQAEHAETEKRTEDQRRQDANKTLTDRMVAATSRYPDFDEVAYAKPAPWLLTNGPVPEAKTLDAWIREHEAGPDVLYYFQSEKNRQELDSLLAKPVIKQVDHLALLSQRLLPQSSSQAGVTGAAAGRTSSYVPPPKPPTPVRTEAQRTSGGPPPTDGSLGVLGHAKAFHRS